MLTKMLKQRSKLLMNAIMLFSGSLLCVANSYAWGNNRAAQANRQPVAAEVNLNTASTAAQRLDNNQNAQTVGVASSQQTGNYSHANNGAKQKININTASVEELQDLKYMSKTKAMKIVKYREENGPFKSLEELLNVKCRGIHQEWLNKVGYMFTI